MVTKSGLFSSPCALFYPSPGPPIALPVLLGLQIWAVTSRTERSNVFNVKATQLAFITGNAVSRKQVSLPEKQAHGGRRVRTSSFNIFHRSCLAYAFFSQFEQRKQCLSLKSHKTTFARPNDAVWSRWLNNVVCLGSRGRTSLVYYTFIQLRVCVPPLNGVHPARPHIDGVCTVCCCCCFGHWGARKSRTTTSNADWWRASRNMINALERYHLRCDSGRCSIRYNSRGYYRPEQPGLLRRGKYETNAHRPGHI